MVDALDRTQIEAICFDLDGTLMDSDDEKLRRWARRIAWIYSKPEKAESLSRKAVMALASPLNMTLSALDAVGLDTPFVRLLMAFEGPGAGAESVPPVDGIREFIPALAERFRLGIVSTRPTQDGDLFLNAHGLRQHFHVLAGRDSTWRIKPHPQPILYAAQQVGVDPAKCLMVGDTAVDMRAARRAGAQACGVLCGFGQRHELEHAGAHLILDHTQDLPALLL